MEDSPIRLPTLICLSHKDVPHVLLTIEAIHDRILRTYLSDVHIRGGIGLAEGMGAKELSGVLGVKPGKRIN